MAKKQKKFSMRPEAGEEGLFGNVEATIAKAFYGTYGEHGEERMIVGNRAAEDPCAVIEFEVEGVDDNPVQFLSCGKAARVVPSDDNESEANEGPFLVPAEGSQAKGLSKQSNMWHFLNSLEKPAEGKLKFDTRPLDEIGLDALVGLRAFFVRVPAAKIGEDSPDRTMLVCERIEELPGKKKAGSSKVVSIKKKAGDEEEEEEEEPTPKKKSKAKPRDEEEEEGDEVKEEAQAIVVKALEKAGEGGIEKGQLVKKIFGAASKSENRKEIVAYAQDEDFLKEGPWNYDEDSETLTALEE